MRCTICSNEGETTYLELYVIGSEGINVCLSCRIALVEFAKRMMHACGDSFKKGYYQGRTNDQRKEYQR